MTRTPALVLTFSFLAACSDKVSSGQGDGSGEDTGTDTVSDAGGDAALDSGDDTTADTADLGGDTVVDAADDTTVDAPDSWTIDCDPAPPACTVNEDCALGEVCDRGDCLAQVAPDAYVPSDELYNVAAIDFPEAGALSGFDIDGDGGIDNLLGLLVTGLPGGPERVEEEANRAFETGLIGLGVEVTRRPETCGTVVDSTAADIAFHFVTRDLDFDGVLSESENAPEPTVQLLPSGFSDDRGPACRMADGSIADDGATLVGAGGVSCSLSFPLLDGTLVMLPVGGVQISADLASFETKDGEAAPNATVGGYVEIEAIVDEANRIAPQCACAGIDTEAPIAETVVESGRLSARCTQDVAGAETCSDTACANLPALCASMGVLGLSADIESPDSDGVRDAVSFGFDVVLEPAVAADPPMAPTLQAIGDHFATNRALRIAAGQTSVRADVMANDLFDPDRDSLLSVEAQPSSEASFEATIVDGAVIVLLNEPLTAAETAELVVDYTIGDGESRSSSATLTVLVSRRTFAPELVYDEVNGVEGDTFGEVDVVANDLAHGDAVVVIDAVSCDYDYMFPEEATWGDACEGTAGSIRLDRARNTVWIDSLELGYGSFYYRAYAWTSAGGDSEMMTTGIYTFLDCPAGSYGTECTACDECEIGDCLDGVYGSGECGCEIGYELVETECVDINECEREMAWCSEGYRCENTPGSYECVEVLD